MVKHTVVVISMEDKPGRLEATKQSVWGEPGHGKEPGPKSLPRTLSVSHYLSLLRTPVHRQVDGYRRTMRSSHLQNIRPAHISTDNQVWDQVMNSKKMHSGRAAKCRNSSYFDLLLLS